jgi:hypothetical protein
LVNGLKTTLVRTKNISAKDSMKVIAEGEVFTTKDNYISYILLIIVCGMYYKDHEQVLPA